MIKQIVISCCLLLSFIAYSQSPSEVASLKIKINEAENSTIKAQLLLDLSHLIYQLRPDEALNYALESLTLSKSIHYTKGKTQAYIIIGNVHFLKKDYEEAEKSYNHAMDVVSSYSDSKGITEVQLLKINLAIANKNPDKAKVLLDEVYAAANKIKSNTYLAEYNYYSAKYNQYLKKYFLALQYAKEANNLAVVTGDNLLNYKTKLLLGELYFLTGEEEMVEEQYLSALKAAESEQMRVHIAEVNYKLGELYNSLNKPDQALIFFKTSLGVAIDIGYERMIKEGYQIISDTYESNGNYQEAYEYLKYYSAIKDTKEINELEAQMALLENNKKIEIQKAKLKNQEEQLTAEKFYKIIGYIVAVVILGLSIFLLISLKQRDKINEQLVKANEEVVSSQKEKEEFFAYTNHEIRTPLNAVVGISKILSETKLNKQQRKYVNTINNSANNILFLVNDVLDLSKIEQGGLEFENIPVNIKNIIDDILQALSFKKTEKGIELKADINPKIKPVVYGDPVRLKQILLNLADNAIKFTDNGSVTIKVELVDFAEHKQRLKFSVIDTGIGIQKDRLQSIFSSYKQEHASTSRNYGGTGLGLTISKLLVDAMHGSLKVDSEINNGSTFHFNIWMEITPDNTKTEDLDPSIGKFTMQNMHILVVDDNEINREVFVDLLLDPKNNVTIDTANHGAEAVRLVQENNYDLLLMDIQMPILNGYEATREIRALETPVKDLPIIAMTAHVLNGVAHKCAAAGMNDSVSKPVNIRLLNQKIKAILPHKFTSAITSTDSSENILSDKNELEELIDLSELKKLTGENPEKIVKYVEMFETSLPKDFKALKKAYEEDRREEIAKYAHKIKGGLGYMGVDSLYSTIYTLEKSEDVDEIKLAVNDLERKIILILRELSFVKQNTEVN